MLLTKTFVFPSASNDETAAISICFKDEGAWNDFVVLNEELVLYCIDKRRG